MPDDQIPRVDLRQKAIERLADALAWRENADYNATESDRRQAEALMSELGLVAVDPALVEAYRRARDKPFTGLHDHAIEAELLADAIVDQLTKPSDIT